MGRAGGGALVARQVMAIALWAGDDENPIGAVLDAHPGADDPLDDRTLIAMRVPGD